MTILDNLSLGEQSGFTLREPRIRFCVWRCARRATRQRLSSEADILIPLAAIVRAPACDRIPAQARSVNLDAVRHLLRCRSPRQLVVYPTTNSGYGTKSGVDYCTEETPLEPISLYGRTKVQAEAAVLESPNTITLRLATVFGMSPRMHSICWSIISFTRPSLGGRSFCSRKISSVTMCISAMSPIVFFTVLAMPIG